MKNKIPCKTCICTPTCISIAKKYRNNYDYFNIIEFSKDKCKCEILTNYLKNNSNAYRAKAKIMKYFKVEIRNGEI